MTCLFPHQPCPLGQYKTWSDMVDCDGNMSQARHDEVVPETPLEDHQQLCVSALQQGVMNFCKVGLA
jgi:hypothetical protein